MYLYLSFIFLLVHTNASPLPASDPPLIFHQPSIKAVDDFGLDLFNLSGLPKHSTSKLEKRFNLPALLCNVVFNGINQGNPLGFVASGQILLTAGVPTNPTINGVNPIDIVIAIGPTDPLGPRPLTGNLRYTTNRALDKYIGGAIPIIYNPYDFAYITSTSTAVSAIIDPRTARLNGHAYFDVGNSVLDPAYIVIGGSISIKIGANNAISGKINFIGDSTLIAGQRPYNAIISGKIAGSLTLVL